MSIAKRVDDFLKSAGIDYDLVTHSHTESSSRTAQVSHIKGDTMAKAVVLHDGERYLLAVVPSTHRVELDTLGGMLDCRLTLAAEGETAKLFDDCALGADPPVGAAYGLPVALDEVLLEQTEIYFEGGDHRSLVRVSVEGFAKALEGARRGRFSHRV